MVEVGGEPQGTGAIANLYVCGITPYDATHLGHAATYLAYDTLVRLWLDAGREVRYVQNTTDVDDPLLERAAATGVDWRVLAASQTDLFRGDMEALGIIPPDHYVAVTEVIGPTADAVKLLVDRGIGYYLGSDVYFDSSVAATSSPWRLGDESGLDRATMLELSAERGGDPERPGKRDPLDPVLWRGARDGEPSWDSPLGRGRPGWHIECAVIAQRHSALPLSVNGGGSDLIFPHHEFSAGQVAALTGSSLARVYSHAGLVGYRGEKMSKSAGNLVLVSDLRERDVDPRVIRLALLGQHYRKDWEWSEALLADAGQRFSLWEAWARQATMGGAAEAVTPLLVRMRALLVHDLDTPAALDAVDAAIAAAIPASPADIAAIEALLGIRL